MRYVVGVDIGGTFTDFVAYDSSKLLLHTEKLLTTPDRPADAVIQGLQKLESKYEVHLPEVRNILHATTLATNAVIERKGALTGLLTTSGFEDVLDIRKGLRYNQYDLNIQVPAPYVPRFLRRGLSERTLASGEVLRKIDVSEVEASVDELVKQGITSLAVCYLHSYANPTHEELTKKLINDKYPDLCVSTSNEITSQVREYERMSTTVVDAYIKPLIKNYVDDLSARLKDLGFAGELLIMTCTGGVVQTRLAKDAPVLLLESGPVAGVSMAAQLAKRSRLKGVFSFDMGGTTAKGCIIRNQLIEKSYEFEAARYDKFRRGSGIPVSIPVVRLIEIGAGGGSIARIDQLGLVRVGPESSGSVPGPACYGKGGVEPTVTDADIVLGYLDEDYFLGGLMPLRVDLSRKAINDNVASKAGLSIEDAAWAIHERVNEDVTSAFRLYASEIGVDYRNYSFIPFGGAGPVHATRIARKLGVPLVVIPPRAGVLSAEGLLVSPLSVDIAQTKRKELSDLDYSLFEATFNEMIGKGAAMLASAGIDPAKLSIARTLDMCYHGQGYEVPVSLSGKPSKGEFAKLASLFEKRYKSKYSIAGFSKSIDVTAFKVTVWAKPLKISVQNNDFHQIRKRGRKRAYDPDSGTFMDFRVISRYSLSKGDSIRGPALVQEIESTTVLSSRTSGTIDSNGNLVVKIKNA
ncbi:MAG: hydantoinase/oxoprolinase family protein [Nitrososphaerota archaeon]|nr:hydantoinase/oxoprolinase family protein [Nitrososphaerota archaeon]